ncbi:hypothetical protein U3A58_00735 [Algoriphagus sp. C2-6-M1]|uniref:hypothetical protein n=1 Tax=Algoriphagus persicinus TaxID=3108754 RepID=UPI002B3BF938|nr:hypothetical protein [Algoriphagus sp. C2-6-M1]MEB2778900.1 hypothetical protein [Algoriphagus sp. C2-6-M1]
MVTKLIADNEAKNAGLVVYVHDACAAFELAWEFGSEIVLEVSGLPHGRSVRIKYSLGKAEKNMAVR